jgi:hypothetical protein
MSTGCHRMGKRSLMIGREKMDKQIADFGLQIASEKSEI